MVEPTGSGASAPNTTNKVTLPVTSKDVENVVEQLSNTQMNEETKKNQDANAGASTEGEEATKMTTMYGARFQLVVKELFEPAQLNMLEQGLLDKYLLDNFDKMPANLVSLARKVLASKPQDQITRRAKKNLEKVIALFEKHEFWSNQPVQTVYDLVEEKDFNKPVEVKEVSDIREEPLPLPPNFYWDELDLQDPKILAEMGKLLKNHYVEDSHGEFRFDYSLEFIRWALNPPGYFPDWIIGVRDSVKNNLYACITGVPVHMTVLGKPILMAEINFLCAHKNLRANRIAPVLIKEITRRVNRRNIWQAIYTAGKTLPTPIATAAYHHRNLNPKKLIDIGFSYHPEGKTFAQLSKLHRFQKTSYLENFRPMALNDVSQVTDLLNAHLATYKCHITFSENEVKHFFLPDDPGIVFSYVVDNANGEITDFASFYALSSTALKFEPDNPEQAEKMKTDKNYVFENSHGNKVRHGYNKVYASYCFYNVVRDGDFERHVLLMKSLMAQAAHHGYDVFNMVEVLQNKRLTTDAGLLFKPGDGRLAHYLYNWRCPAMEAEDIGIILV